MRLGVDAAREARDDDLAGASPSSRASRRAIRKQTSEEAERRAHEAVAEAGEKPGFRRSPEHGRGGIGNFGEKGG